MQPLKNNLKLTLQMLFILTVLSNQLTAQGIIIGSGTTFTGGSATITLLGNWSNSGTFTPGTSTVIFNGTGGSNQTITNANEETFYNLTVNKSTAAVQLVNNISVTNQLTVSGGDLDLNGNTVSLGTTGKLIESTGSTVIGSSGTISAGNSALNAPSSYNMGGLGAEITSSANLGNTTITRGDYAQTGATHSSIKRFYDISPTTNTGLSATLVFHYDDSELNGLTESTLKLYRSTTGGSTWTEMGGTVNTTNNTVTLSGISSFSRWTLGSSASPLPVELTSFKANVIDNSVILNLETATEVNNYGFEIERSAFSAQRSAFEKIGFVAGHGNSNTPQSYSFIDDNTLGSLKFSYRLKQIDTDGKFEYSDILTVRLNLPGKTQLLQNSPNPFNPTTSIKYFIPEQADITIKIYDMLGREVTTLFNNKVGAGYHITFWNGRDKYGQSVSSGVYLYRLTAYNKTNSFSKTKKMTLLK